MMERTARDARLSAARAREGDGRLRGVRQARGGGAAGDPLHRRARLDEVVDGRKLRFAVEVVAEDGRTIGVGTHERRIVDLRGRRTKGLKLSRRYAFALGALAVAVAGRQTPERMGGTAPLRVRSASVTQAGPGPRLGVELGDRSRRRSLKQERRTLCLLLERVRNTSVSGVLCVGSKPAPEPGLFFQPYHRRGRGPGQPISATITRAGRERHHGPFRPERDRQRVHVDPLAGDEHVRLSRSIEARARRCFLTRPALAKLHVPQVVGCVAEWTIVRLRRLAKRPRHRAHVRRRAVVRHRPPRRSSTCSSASTWSATFFEIGEQIAP